MTKSITWSSIIKHVQAGKFAMVIVKVLQSMEDNTRTESWTEGLTQNGDYWEGIVKLDLVLW